MKPPTVQQVQANDLIGSSPKLGQPMLVQRYDAAISHLMAAAMLTRSASRLEVELGNRDIPYGPLLDEIRWNVTAAVIMSVAALEANLNELQDDVGMKEDDLKSMVCKSFKGRHDFTLEHLNKPELDWSKAPAQNVTLLIKLRNELVHPRPEWGNQQNKHKKLGKNLRDKFELSRFHGNDAPIFPTRVMSHGCASWAVNSAYEFGEEVSLRLRDGPKFGQFASSFSTSP